MKWLDRSIIVGPFLTLVLNERDCWKAYADCGIDEDQRCDFVQGNAHATTHILQKKDGQIACVVAMREWHQLDPIAVAGLLVHEAVHVWQATRDDQMREKNPGYETEAYAIQWISQQLMWSFVEQTKGKKK